jgi:putative intracellular protease/amidase
MRRPYRGAMSLRGPNVTNPKKRQRVAIVIANQVLSTTPGWPVDFWSSELTHRHYALRETSNEIELLTPAGRACAADAMSSPYDSIGYSSADLITAGVLAMKLDRVVDDTKKGDDIEVAAVDASLVAGGQAPMFTFEVRTLSIRRSSRSAKRARSRPCCVTGSLFCAERGCRTGNSSPRRDARRRTATSTVRLAQIAADYRCAQPCDLNLDDWRSSTEMTSAMSRSCSTRTASSEVTGDAGRAHDRPNVVVDVGLVAK